MAGFLAIPAHAQDATKPVIRIAAGQEIVFEGEEATFTLTRSGDAAQPLAVTVVTFEPNHPNAHPGDDASNPTRRVHAVTFLAGDHDVTLSVPVDRDGVEELDTDDKIVAQISADSSSPYQPDPDEDSAEIPIAEPALVTIAANEDPVVEGEDATFTLTRSGDTTGALPVQVRSAHYNGGTTRAIVDNHAITFEAGAATAVLTVPTADDGIPEFRDWVVAVVEPGSGYLTGDPGRATIRVEDPPLPEVSIVADQDSVAEGEAAMFTLTRSGPTTIARDAIVIVSDPGAFLRGNHWARTPPGQITVHFAAGSATARLSLQTRDDWRDIQDTDLTVSVTASDYYEPGDPASARVTVTDNDVAPELELTLSETRIVEGGILTVTLRLHGGSGNEVQVGVTHGYRGQPRTDYVSLGGSDTEWEFVITTDDNDLDEPDRVYEATILSYPSDSLAHAESEYRTIRGDRSVSATVADNDLPLVSIEAVRSSYQEGEFGQIRLRRTGDPSVSLNVSVDFTQSPGVTNQYPGVGPFHVSHSFRPGVTEHVSNFDLERGDGDEADGYISLTIRDSPGHRIDPDAATARFAVVDTDPPPTLSLAGARAGENGGTVDFLVSLASDVPSRRTVSVEYATADGTAGAGEDYTATSGTLTFQPGQISATVSVPVSDDYLAENDESFTLTLANPVNVTLPDGVDSVSATGTIEDDEPVIHVSARRDAVTEGEAAVFDLTRDPNADRELTVTLIFLERLDNGSIVTESQTVTFPANAGEVEWSAGTEDDDVDEPHGWVGVTIPDPVTRDLAGAYSSGSTQVVGVDILDNDLPTVTIEAGQGDREEGQDVEFTLTRQGDLSVLLTVNVTITGGGDYLTEAPPQTVAFAEGASTASLSLPTEDDDPVDDDDTLTVTVAAGNDYQAGEPAAASVSLFDSQRFYPSVSIRANRAVVDEGEEVVFTLTRTGAHLDESLTVWVGVIEEKTQFLSSGSHERRKYGKVVSVEFAPGSRTAALTQPTVDETLNDGNSSFEATIRLGDYRIRPYPGEATAWVRDDDIPTVSVVSATAARVEGDPRALFLVVDGQIVSLEVLETGFAEIVEDAAELTGVVLSRTGDTTGTLTVRWDSYGISWSPGRFRFRGNDILVDGETFSDNLDYYGDFVIPEGDEASVLDPAGRTDEQFWNIPSGQVSMFHNLWPIAVGSLGGLIYYEVNPFYCETVPGDCGYSPQYRVGDSDAAAYRILNSAQGVRIEADSASVTEGEDITFTLHRFGSTRPARIDPLPVKVQVVQNGEFIAGVPPQTVTFAGSPDDFLDTSTREGELSTTVTISTTNDSLDEADGDITLTIIPLTVEEAAESATPYELVEAYGDSTWTHQVTVRVLDDDEVGFDISDAAADEAAGSIEFTVTLPDPSALETRVDWATAPGSGLHQAVAGEDYEAAGGTLTFAPGETSKTIVVTLLDDDVNEERETFLVELSNPAGASLTAAAGTGAIIDDDAGQRVSVSTDSDSFVEGQDVVFRLERCSFVNEQDCTQDEPRGRLELTPTLFWDGDFLLDTSGLLVVFEAGSWTTTVTLPTVDDDVFEATGFAWLSNAALPGDPDSQAGGISKSVDIHDNDMPVSIVTAVEAGEGDGTITFAVELEAPAVLPVTVDIATVDGTATSFDFGASSKDFEPRRATLIFQPGEQSKDFTVTLVDDRLDESREQFTVELSNPVNARIKDGIATGSIEDDDDALTARLIPPAQTEIPEGSDAAALFMVELSHAETSFSKQAATVDWAVTPGTAAQGEDYVEASGRVIIPAGQSTGIFAVTLVDDSRFEAWTETFTVTLTGGERVEIDEDQSSAEIRIRDDESVGVALFADAAHVTEGGIATFTVQLTGARTTAAVTVEYETAGDAMSGEDYTAPGGTLTIPAGHRFGVVSIATLADGVDDSNETLTLQLTAVTSLERPLDQKKSAASVTILDEDEPAVSLAPVAPEEGPGTPIEGSIAAAEAVEGKVVQFTVSLSHPADAPVVVEWETREYEGDPSPDGRATADRDYTSSSGTVTIAATETSTTFGVPTNEDAVFEGNEVFQVVLTGATKGADPATAVDFPLGVFSAVGRILDDDDSPHTVLLTTTPKAVAEDAGATQITVVATLPGGANTLSVDTEVSVWVAGGSAAEGDDYTATGATLVILAGERIGTGTLTLTPVEDLFAEGDETVQVTGTATGLNVTPVPVTITDNDTQPTGVTLMVAPDAVDEGAGATSLYVTAAFTDGDVRGADTEIVVSVAGASLTVTEETLNSDGTTTTTTKTTTAAGAEDFTADSITVAIPAGETQGAATLTLTPMDDAVAEGDETVQVSGAASGLAVTAAGVTITDNDAEPTGIELLVTPEQVDEDAGDADLQVTGTLTGGGSRTEDTSISLSVHGVTATDGDDYSPPPDVTLTIPAGSLTGTATLTLTLVNDDLYEGEEQLAVRGSNADPGLPVDGVRVAIADDDTAPTSITLALDMNTVPEDAGLQELSVTATLEGGSKRTVDTQIMLSVSNLTTSDADYSVFPAVLTIDSGQPLGTATMLLIPADDSIDEDDETLEVRGTTAELTLPVAAQQVTITDDDSAGVSIDSTALTVVEGGSADYTVALDSQPTGDVTVTISGHSGSDLNLSAETLTFTPDNWNVAQTVTVTAGQDDDAAADAAVTLSHAVSGAVEYAAVSAEDIPSVTVTIEEDDAARVSIDPTELTVTEGDATGASYTVVLDSQPTADVTVDISGHAGTDVLVTPSTLTFTSDSWETPQTVTVSAAQDDDAAADQAVTLSHAVSGAGEYAAVSAEDIPSVTVTIEEDDATRVSIDPTELTVTEGDATGASYTVVLDTQPTADVTVAVTGHAGTDLSLSGQTLTNDELTFTPDNWNQPQTVTVTAGQDDDAAADEAVTLSHTVSGAAEYQAVTTDSVTVTIDEDDAAAVSIDPTTLTVPEGGDNSYTVVLDTQPSAEVTVTISGHAGTDVSVTPSSLTFTSESWGTAQTVTVSAAQDEDAATDEAVTLSHTVSGTGEYQAVTAESVTVTIDEDDAARVSIDPTALIVIEGDATGASYAVVLDSQPTAEVTVTVSGHDGTDVSVAPSTLTFTSENWETPQTVTVSAAQDEDAAADPTVTLSHAVGSVEDTLYNGIDPDSVTVTIEEDDAARVSIDPTALTVPEGGDNSYTVVLDTQPSAEVTVTISGHSGSDLNLSAETLTFTSVNWNQAQTVTVSADQDADAAADPAVTLSHAVSGAGEYAAVSAGDIPNVTVTIDEDDAAGVSIDPTELTVTEGDATGASYTVVLDTQPTADVTVAVTGHAGTDLSLSGQTLTNDELTFTPDNWNQPQTVTVTAGQDDDAAADEAVTLSHTVSGAAEYQAVTTDSVTVTIDEDDAAAVSIDPTTLTVPEGGDNSYTVVLDTQPSAEVTVTISGHAGTDVSVTPSSLTFTSESWGTAQTVTVSAAQDEDAATDEAVTLSHTVSGTGEYQAVTAESVTVTIDEDDAARVSIDPTALIVIEGDATGASYAVVLDSQPTAEVTVTVSGHDGTDVSVAPSTLTFTSENWETPQTVTVSAAQDEDAAADPTVTLSHAVGSVEDTLYNGIDPDSVTVTIEEDDAARVSIDPTTLTVPEGGDNSYTVVLDTQPSAEVTVTISGHAGTDVSVTPSTLTFTSENWGTAQMVTVSADQDDDAAPDPAVTLSHAVSGAVEYAAVSAGDIPNVTVTIDEDDAAGVSINPTALTVVEGQSNSYTVVLDTQPSADVSVTISGHSGSDLNLSAETLTFTPDNWNVAQSISVTADQDDDAAADPAVTLSHAVSGAVEYAAVSAEDIPSVTVTIDEDDAAGVSINPTALTVVEGQSNSYTVVLDTQPSADVTVTISGHSGSDLNLSAQTLTFTPANWNVAQSISVTADQDDDAAADPAVTLSHAVSGAVEYAAVSAEDIPGVTVTIDEDDAAGVSINPTALTVVEGQSNSYTVVLDTQPSVDVTVTISGHSGSDLNLSAETLTFTPANWNVAQSISVTADQDADAAADPAVTLSHAVSGAVEYAAVSAEDIPNVTVTIDEDDAAGVSINPTALTVVEGSTASYTVVLDTQPSADVTVAATGHAGTDLSLSGQTLTNDELTFTPDNWNQPQTVTITAGQDDDAAADAAVTLSHAVSGAVEYAAVSAEDIPGVTVTIEEDDAARVSIDPTELIVPEGGDNFYTVVLDTQPSAEVTVTISGHDGTDVSLSGQTLTNDELTFTPDNWNQPQTVTITAGQDDDAAADAAVTLSHAVSGAVDYAAISAGDIPSVTVTIDEDDAAGVSINPTALTVIEGQSNSYTVVLDTQPTGDVTVTVDGHVGTELLLSGETLVADALTFTSQNWDTPQTVTLNAGSVSTNIQVTLNHTVSGGDYGFVTVEGVNVTIVDSPEEQEIIQVGVTESEQSLTVIEGGSNVYEVVLSEPPTSDVTVTVSVEDGANNDITTEEASLVFTTGNWNLPQTVTVRAAHDDDALQDPVVRISHGVSGANFADHTIPGVLVTISEDDFPRVTVTPQFLEIMEGSSGSYTVVLTARPSADVTVTISGHDGTDVSVAPSSLTFTSESWGTAQTVTVSAAQDEDAATDEAVTLSHTVSGTGEYQAVTAESVTVTIDEDDAARVSIDPTALTVTEGDATGASYAVVLDTQPTAEVTVTISGHADTDIALSDTVLTFTSENWETPQTVTVSAAQDEDAVTDQAVTLAHAVAGAEEYQAVTAGSVTVTIDEDDAARVSIDPTTLTVPEGGDNSYTVVLDTQPSAEVTVTISGHAGTDVSVTPSTLTFTSENWGTAQMVTVSADQDDDAAPDPAVTLSHAVSGAVEYAAVSAGDIPSVTVTIDEDDAAGVSINPTALTVVEGQSNSYTVVLDTQPSADVTSP